MMEGVAARHLCLQRGLKGGNEALQLDHSHPAESQERGRAGLQARAWSTSQRGGLLASEASWTINRDKLKYTRMVLSEALRLYPPAWLMTRRAREEVVIGDYRFPQGTFFLLSPYLTHRDPRFFADPEAFVPTRWGAPPDAGSARYAYVPFGGGPRQCLGEGFAWMEGLLVLTTVAQMWRMQLVPGPPVEPWGLVTLRPKASIHMRLARR